MSESATSGNSGSDTAKDSLPYYCDAPTQGHEVSWRWPSQWPTVARLGLIAALILSGGSDVPNGTLIQTIPSLVIVVWAAMDLLFNPDNPKRSRWTLRRRIAVVVATTSLVLVAIVLRIVWTL